MAARIMLTVPMDTWRLLASELKPKQLPVVSTLLATFTPASFRRQFVEPFGSQQDLRKSATEPMDTLDAFRSVHCVLAGENPDVKLKVLLASVFEQVLSNVQQNSLPVVEMKTPVSEDPFSNTLYRIGDALFPISSTKLGISCDADVVPVNYGNFYVVRARRPIKKGALITRSIGANYLYRPLAFRRSISVQMRLTGDCKCLACVEDWPQIDALAVCNWQESKFKCPGCGHRFGKMKDFVKNQRPNSVCPGPRCNAKLKRVRDEFDAVVKFQEKMRLTRAELAKVLEMQNRARALFEPPNTSLLDMDQRVLICCFAEGNARPVDEGDATKDADRRVGSVKEDPSEINILSFA